MNLSTTQISPNESVLLGNFSNTSSNSSITLSENINQTDALWVLVSFTLIFLMIPGLSLFYSGYVKRINTLSIFTAMFMAFAVVCIQWFLFGYSLTFAQNSGSKLIGNFEHLFLINIGLTPNKVASTVPSNLFMIFQSLFAAITPCLFFGSIAERATITSFVTISFFWTTFVYDFIAYWTWNKNGWLNLLGVLDFAGGGPVHISSGFAALAFALAVGPRRISPKRPSVKPTNLSDIFLGTGLLWFGWFGFNGGSEGSMNVRAVNAVATSNFAACAAGLTWVVVEAIFKRTKKLSLNGFCSGAIAGLVAITPACGFVDYPSSLLIGFAAALFCFMATGIKRLCGRRFDDTCDVFAVHGIGGIVGSILTGFLAKNSIVTLSDQSISGGAIDGNWMLVAYQCLAVVVTATWSFTITFILVKIYSVLPFLKLRLDTDEERVGSDLVELGESAFGVELASIKSPIKVNPIPEKTPVPLMANFKMNNVAITSNSTLRQKIELQRKTLSSEHF